MGKRRAQRQAKWGHGKHRAARVKRFAARHPGSKKIAKKGVK